MELAKQAPKEDLGRRLKPFFTSDGPMIEALANVVRLTEALALGLAGMDLITEEGRFRALQQQGQITGLQLALDAILRPVLEMNDDGTA